MASPFSRISTFHFSFCFSSTLHASEVSLCVVAMACYFHSVKSLSGPVPSVSKGAARNDVPALPSTPAPVGIDLTDPELRSRGMLIPGHWQLQQDYEHVSIGELAPGPRRVVLTARVVNLHDQVVHSKMQKSAQGCLKILCKDDSALMLVCCFHFSFFCCCSLTYEEDQSVVRGNSI
jgi:hypothetical protein